MKNRILYIEDNPLNMRLIERSLKSFGCELLKAFDGRTGLALAQTEGPRLILLDMDLPDINGLDVLARLRQDHATAQIPVVVLTADMTRDTMERSQALGAEAFLNKPVSRGQLLRTLTTFAAVGV